MKTITHHVKKANEHFNKVRIINQAVAEKISSHKSYRHETTDIHHSGIFKA